MINLGPYSGKNCPNVRFQPTVIDRILEGTALLIVLVTWISIYNAAVQYLFAIRLTRVMNIILLLVLLGSVWGLYYAFGKLLLLVSFVLLGVAFIGYYILAFKYK